MAQATSPAKTKEIPPKVVSKVELFTWKAPVRPFKKRNKEFFTTIAAVAFLLAVIFFTLQGPLSVVVIVALVFLVYVLSSITPEEVEHKITNKGVIFAGKEYFWNQLIRFWFTNRFGTDLLIIETTRIPGRLELVIDNENKTEVRKILEEHLENEEANPNFMDKAASWLSRRLPLEG